MKSWRFCNSISLYFAKDTDSPCSQWKTNRNSYAIYQMAPFSVTLNALTHVSRSRQYSTLNISVTVQDRHIFRPAMYN